jgi:hypothetical protein
MTYFDKDICRVTFTHTDCSDVWCAYFGEMKKFSDFKLDHYMCINSNKKNYLSSVPQPTKAIFYNDKFKYTARLKNCLDQIKNYKYILFDHEDMFLYAKPNLRKLSKYYKLIKNAKYDSIRLAKDSISTAVVSKYDKTLYEISDNSNWFFSIQPSIWHLTKFKKSIFNNLEITLNTVLKNDYERLLFEYLDITNKLETDLKIEGKKISDFFKLFYV